MGKISGKPSAVRVSPVGAHNIVSADISHGVVISKSGTWDAPTKCGVLDMPRFYLRTKMIYFICYDVLLPTA